MASIKNSLRKIYTALGGSNSKSKTITGLLDDISTVASSGGGGGVEIVDVTVQGTGSSSTVDHLDKTFNDLLSAYNDGKLIVAKTIINTGSTSTPMMFVLGYSNYMGGVFSGFSIDYLEGGTRYYSRLNISSRSSAITFMSI